MRKTCYGMAEAVYVLNHNTVVFDNAINKINKKIRKLEKGNCFFAWLGIIFGIVIELRIEKQNKEIEELHEDVSELLDEIMELRGREGD